MENNIPNDDDVLEARIKEQLEAAAEQTNYLYTVSEHYKEQMGAAKSGISRTRKEIISGYLFENWTWISGLEEKYENDEDIPAPAHCEHVDPMNPAVWVGFLRIPNYIYCMDCAVIQSNKDEQDIEWESTCDRCLGKSEEFYEFSMPVVNIQMMGHVCKGCLDKV